MKNHVLSDKDLDKLLMEAPHPIEDNGFSDGVLDRLKKRSLLVFLIPMISGLVGAIITFFALPKNWYVGILPSFDASTINKISTLTDHIGVMPIVMIAFLVLSAIFTIFTVRPD